MTDPQINLDPITSSIVRLTMMCEGIPVSRGTGFLWSEGGPYGALVTNWHNLTGTNPYTGKANSSTGARPTSVMISQITNQAAKDYNLEAKLYADNGQAWWSVHPDVGEMVDIAILPLGQPTKEPVHFGVKAISRPIDLIELPQVELFPAQELYVVGYPRNIEYLGTPIWKRASLASSPALFRDEKGFRRSYIDCASREGMSGSPVFAKQMRLTKDSANNTISLETHYDLCGIYSGRLIDQGEDPRMNDLVAAQIGLMWRRPLIERVAREGVPDTFTREGTFTPQGSHLA